MPGIRDKHRKTFVGMFTGEEFRLRKIKPSEFMQHLGTLPAETTDTLSAQLKALGDKLREVGKDPIATNDMMQFYLERGVVSPKIFFGTYDDCPEDQIHVDDLSDDATGLVNAIAEYSFDFSGFKKKMEHLLQGGQSGLAGHAGEEIREVTDRSPPNGVGQ